MLGMKKAASDIEMQQHNRLKEQVIFPSRYEFLKSHKGIRPNSLHGLMGTMGSGKSTLFKCIIVEAAQRARVMVYLSEETTKEYQELIQYLDKGVLKNITFVEEKEIPQEIRAHQKKFLEYFEQLVETSDVKLVFIDNVTTSIFYNMKFGLGGQGITAEYFLNFVKTRCSIFYVAHAETGITDNYNKVVAPENMRGSKELPIITEYFYIIQKFTSNDKIYTVLRNAKYRHYKDAAGWYALKFEQSAYIGDAKVPFELINKIFKSRDFLGRASPKVQKKDPEPSPQERLPV